MGQTRSARRRRTVTLVVIAAAVLVAVVVVAVVLVEGWSAVTEESTAASGEGVSSVSVIPPLDPDTSSESAPQSAGTAESRRQLDGLTVLPDRPDVPGYQRGCGSGQRCSFGQAWTDDSAAPDGHNGCGTRNDVLRKQLTDVVLADGSRCVVVAGTLHDPYTGTTIAFRKSDAAAVQIDHVYALARAFDMGAAGWTQEQRTAFANDTAVELLAVDGAVNQAKGDSGPAEWMPPDPADACGFVRRYIAIAAAYRLAITAAEYDSMAGTLAGCG